MENLTTSEKIKIKDCSIVCNEHPEWGVFGVLEDKGEWFVILGNSGSRILCKEEANNFWSVR